MVPAFTRDILLFLLTCLFDSICVSIYHLKIKMYLIGTAMPTVNISGSTTVTPTTNISGSTLKKEAATNGRNGAMRQLA